ncbi:MAG: hypothetical protein IJ761_00970 [Bacteroidales bacterium]|nr:hypothetical protein [Bacteroidales bacterium]
MRLIKPFVGILLCALTVLSCSTEKAKWTNIQYHNLTCHYNIWWNGNESLKAGREKLHQSISDDYTRLLPVERLGTLDKAQAVFPEMDRAIEKGVKGIQKHSIYLKGTEYVPYIKECYLLTAYATFYKQDYASTNNTCQILVTQFTGTRAANEGAVLMARCMIGEKRYAEAETLLDQLVTDLENGSFYRSQQDKLYLAMVEATVPQGKYKKAVEYIHLSLSATNSRDTKARLTFLLAQIYQQLGKRTVASKYYHQVLGHAPEYVMEFNAKLGEASCADLEHSDLKKLERQLDDLLHDKKNDEYRDQIYFAKGEMYMGMKDAKKACDNYRLSVATSRRNNAQKAKSALRLADVLYSIYEDYPQAKIYYDTAMPLLSASEPDYGTIKRRHDVLVELVKYTSVYERCDSLLAVSAMSNEDRMRLIMAQIDSLNQREQRAAEQANKAQIPSVADLPGLLKGDWYFYNQSVMEKGMEGFRQRWGTRQLDDMWFMSHRSSALMLSMDIPQADAEADDDTSATNKKPTTAADSLQGNPNDPHHIAYYLKDLPQTQHQMDSIDSLTAQSLLSAAYLFYDGVKNTPKAVECYLRLATDYTQHDEVVQAFYMLYRIFDRQGNTPQANYYRDMVLMGFPDSDYANLIRDNEYYKEIIKREHRIEQVYEEVYDAFSRHRYSEAILLSNRADSLFPGNTMQYKFAYWKGMALTAKQQIADARSIFEHIIDVAPATDSIVPIVKLQLALLQIDSVATSSVDDTTITEADEQRLRNNATTRAIAQISQTNEEEPLPPEAQMYRYRDKMQHYVVVVVNDRTIKATELQYKLSDFNSAYYSNNGYKVNALLFTDSTQLLTVHRFLGVDDAMRYYHHLHQDTSPLHRYNSADYTVFVISTQNYATFYNRKNISAYSAFFKRYYLDDKKQ